MKIKGVTPAASLSTSFKTPGHADITKKVELLCARFPLKKPKHKDIITDTVNGSTWSFGAGKFLNGLARHFIGYVKRRALGPVERRMLYELPWFEDWLEKLHDQRVIASGVEPSTDDKLNALFNEGHLQTAPCSTDDPVVITDVCGRNWEIDLYKFVEDILPNFVGRGLLPGHTYHVSEQTQARARNTAKWLAARLNNDSRGRRALNFIQSLSKDTKIELLIYHYPTTQPGWNDVLPLCMPDSTTNFVTFYPGLWLDDILNNWIRSDDRPNIAISCAQREAIEMLPWCKGWIDNARQIDGSRKRALYEIMG